MKMIALLALISINSTFAAPFTLKCKAGSKMRLDIKTHLRGTISATLHFIKAKQGADRATLKESECAWPHRALNSREPNKITTEFAFIGKISLAYFGTGNSQFSISARPGVASEMAQNIVKIKKAIVTNRNFSIVAPFDSSQNLLFIEKVLY